ncbi:hypothetical protein DFJ58DRAFT_843329 [Suillus subalutaceus]|uniref:uncharacterized protein n=1 Tax=Suillus subalutaceus TaxID=48586 RepID=UPI001B866100|nr:uncharacterized protein DFJ58DRAFT_843329 [Suillus subalutaceus]KAG1847012.1 hypothetical protein DFJ58DRAFT_843329 [Suillus subalutaceus]
MESNTGRVSSVCSKNLDGMIAIWICADQFLVSGRSGSDNSNEGLKLGGASKTAGGNGGLMVLIFVFTLYSSHPSNYRSDSITIRHYQMLYFSDGTHVFQAGSSLFRVHASILGDKSLAFRDMFAASQGAQLKQVDGSADDKPICVPSQMHDARVYAVHHLQRQRYSLEPTQLVSLAFKYNVKEFLLHAFE